MTTTVQSVLDQFGFLANDTASVRWPTAERLAWINEGQGNLVTFRNDANIKTAVLKMVVGARQSLSNSTDCHKILGVRAGGTNRSVLPCDRSALDAFMPGWMADAKAEPAKNWMPDESPMAIWVYPSQLNAGGQLLITYVAYPPPVTQGGNLGVSDAYATNIINYLVYRALSKEDEAGAAEKAAAAYALFKE